MILNEKQIQFVQSKLEESALRTKTIKEELLDHLCSDIEFKMGNGASFSQATATTFDTFQEDEMQEIEQHSMHLLNQKSSFMKKVSLLTLGLFSVVFFIIFNQENVKDLEKIIPISPPIPITVSLNEEPPSISPLEKSFKVVSGYGMRLHPVTKIKKLHFGVDFTAPEGTPVFATSDGIIEQTGSGEKKGLYIAIKHDEIYQTQYFHLSKIDVTEGQSVKKGEKIGEVGNTGMSVKPHLHYEVRKEGKSVDPEPYLKP